MGTRMKRRVGGILCAALVLSAFTASCGKKEPAGIRKPDGAEEFEKEASSLRERFPQYYDLSDFKGLEVYVWSLAEGSYSCGVLPGTNRNKTRLEIRELGMHGAGVDEMKEILASYDVPDDEIFLYACSQPISGYLYPIDEAYCEAVSAQFDNRYPCFRLMDYME